MSDGGGLGPNLLIDCDPGHDDVLAILVAARHAHLVGITTVSGNAPLADTTRNTLALCELAGLDVAVHAGADRPLVGPPRHGPAIHGANGLGGAVLAEPRRSPASHDAAGFIIEAARTIDQLWLVPTGPLTNVALALRRAPDIAGRLAGISFMGGSAGAGNVTPAAEFNIWADPEAAAVVVGAAGELAGPLLMSGLDLTRQLMVDDPLVARLAPAAAAGHPVAALCVDLLTFYLDRQEEVTGQREGPAHDVCAVLAVTHPELIELRQRPVQVELAGRHTRGMTVVDDRPRPGPPAQPCLGVGCSLDAATARTLIVDAICGAGFAW